MNTEHPAALVSHMQKLAAAYGNRAEEYRQLAEEFYNVAKESPLAHDQWIGLIQDYIRHNQDIYLVLTLFDYMTQDELCQIFDELVYLAVFWIPSVDFVRETILSLPHDWVVARIEASAEAFLDEPHDPDPSIAYSLLVGLYERLDVGITMRLAERAMRHTNEEIRELGELVFSEQREAYHALLHKDGARD
ncbi:hypothetical protein F8S13_05805 [Chloroflexia bacterium SDU3-3]|nr:hypothetical protein F8S13_05805 [Chloroflexia bacterium SDU3-3]